MLAALDCDGKKNIYVTVWSMWWLLVLVQSGEMNHGVERIISSHRCDVFCFVLYWQLRPELRLEAPFLITSHTPVQFIVF